MRDNARFLSLNPQIAKLFSNDISLGSICMLSDLNSLVLHSLAVPKLYCQSDIAFDMYNVCIETYIHYLLNMVVNNKLYDELHYKNCNCTEQDVKNLVNTVTEAFDIVHSKYIEYFSGIYGVEIESSMVIQNGYVVKFSLFVKLKEHYIGALKDTFNFLKVALYVNNTLKKVGKIQNNMSDYTKARILYNWVVLHCNYDTGLNKMSFSGFSALIHGYAVCQGFTALFNVLCKLNCIMVTGMSGEARNPKGVTFESHIWSYIILDGRYTYIDVTWGKPILSNLTELQRLTTLNFSAICDFSFFDIPKNVLEIDHRWDKSIYG